jgi:hypothetical protein
MITRNNYEEFFIDYIDGNLSEQQMAEFNAFLLSNPDLATELDFVSTVKLEPAVGNFDTSPLKKDISDLPLNDKNADELMVSLLENDYPQNQQPQLLQWIENSTQRKREFEIFKKTKLEAPHVFMESSGQLQRLPNFENDAVTVENAHMFAIASAEGDLSDSATNRWLHWFSANVLQNNKEFDFDSIKLVPNYSIVFHEKENLFRTRRTTLSRALWYTSSIAAGLALMFGTWIGIRDWKQEFVTNTAQVIIPQEVPVNNLMDSNTVNDKMHVEQLQQVQVAIHKEESLGVKRERIAPMKSKHVEVNEYMLVRSENVHGHVTDWTYALASAYEPLAEEEITDTEETQEMAPKIIQRGGLGQIAQWGLKKLNRNPERFNIETRYNDNNEMTYFALQTPIFAFERNRK